MTAMRYGVVQGRLVPQVGSFVQDFPKRDWLNELTVASKVGCSHVEWIVTDDTVVDNPIMTMSPSDIAYIRTTLGVAIDTICYDAILAQGQIDHETRLKMLVDVCERLKIDRIVVPLLENASVRLPSVYSRTLDMLRRVNIDCAVKGVRLSFETDLDYTDVLRFVKAVGAPPLGMHLSGYRAYVTLDTGNIARLGYDIATHLDTYGDIIDNVHLKDMSCVGGRSVALGTGIVTHDVFGRVCELARAQLGRVTFQTSRQPDMTDIEVFDKNVAYVESFWS